MAETGIELIVIFKIEGGGSMPRGRRIGTQSIEEQITKLDSEVERYKQKISLAREKRKTLLSKKEKEEMSELYQAIKTSGKTAGDFLNTLNDRTK